VGEGGGRVGSMVGVKVALGEGVGVEVHVGDGVKLGVGVKVWARNGVRVTVDAAIRLSGTGSSSPSCCTAARAMIRVKNPRAIKPGQFFQGMWTF